MVQQGKPRSAGNGVATTSKQHILEAHDALLPAARRSVVLQHRSSGIPSRCLVHRTADQSVEAMLKVADITYS